jgi:ketosteroid isomerase-like protein
VASDSERLAVVEAYIDAYNAKDLDRVAEVLSPDLRMRHHNRGFDLKGRDALLEGMRQFEGITPDRRYHSARRRLVCAEQVVVEHTWEATFLADVEGFGAAAGDAVAIDLCSIFTVRDGLIVEYDDYG